MICFPLDNTEYEANALGAWCGTRTRGVFSGDDHFEVTANGDMSVTVGPGLGWLKADDFWGVCLLEANATVLPIDTADGLLSRVDVICLQLNKNMNDGALVIKKGGYSPQPPIFSNPVRNLDYDEIYIASIRVHNGATSILQTDITDLRLDETYCGIMRDGVTGIPTAALHTQWTMWFEAFSDSAEAQMATWTAEQKAEFGAWMLAQMEDFAQWRDEEEQKFYTWLDRLEDDLDDNAAASLAARIEHVASNVTGEASLALPLSGWAEVGGVISQTVGTAGQFAVADTQIVSAIPADMEDYGKQGILMWAVTEDGRVEFRAKRIPDRDLQVTVGILRRGV